MKGKSTAIHARVLSPNDVQIFQYPDIPDFLNAQNSVILYPGKVFTWRRDLLLGCNSFGRVASKEREETRRETIGFEICSVYRCNMATKQKDCSR